MKKYKLILIVVPAVVLAVFVLGRYQREGLAPGRRAPEFTLPDLSGEEISLQEFRGQVVMLNFWSAACAPCREKMPGIQRLYDEFKAAGFAVVAVNVNDPSVMVRSHIEANDYTFTVLKDDGEVSRIYELRFIPKTIILDRDGIIRFVTVGQVSEEKLRSVVISLL